MSIAIIGLITMAIGAISAFRSSIWAVTVLCCTALLGAASAMAFGGANISPGHLAVGFLAVSVFIRSGQRSKLATAFLNGRPGIYLAAIIIWAVASGYLMPRLFAGQVMVYPLNNQLTSFIPVPLYPVGSNLNQAVYAIAGPLVFALVAALARNSSLYLRVANAIIFTSS